MRFRYSIEDEFIKMYYFYNNFVLAICNMIDSDEFFIYTDSIQNNKFLLKILEFLKSKDFDILYKDKDMYMLNFFGNYENYKFKISDELPAYDDIDAEYFLLKLSHNDLLKFKMLFPLEFDEIIHI